MSVLGLIFDRLNIVGAFKQLGSTQQRKDTLFALAFGQLLVQSTFIPITLTIPSIATYFSVDIDDASWSVIARLLVLGSTVFISARLGDKYGYALVFFVGLIVMSIANLLAATSGNLTQLIIWSGLGGVGGALVSANSNAILSVVFSANERGRAFAVPVTASRIGTLLGVGLYGLFLSFVSWRLVFVSTLLMGLLAIYYSYPILKYHFQGLLGERKSIKINYLSAALLVATLSVFILSGSHLHDGSESFTSPEALGYHVPMHALALALGLLFFVTQIRSSNPFLDFQYFRRKYFSMALFSNTTFHLSMLTIFTLVPIVVEDGLGYTPLVVSCILLVHQSFGLWLPAIAGMIYDRYNTRWLGPVSLMLVAIGVGLLGIFAAVVPVWGIPILLIPASIGTGLFISPYNALVMNTLPENRGFASGMLETTRQMGHTIGTTMAAMILGLSLPATIGLISDIDAQIYYQQGFRLAALTVVWIVSAGCVVALFQKVPVVVSTSGPQEGSAPASAD